MRNTRTHVARLVGGAALLTAFSGLGPLACGPAETPPQGGLPDPVGEALQAGFQVDTVGVRDLSEADTLNLERGLTIIETTVTFRRAAKGAEAFAWEFEARALHPVKLILVSYSREERSFELVGESPMVVPRQLGLNRMALPEPIPVSYGTMFGIYQPEESTVPFRQVLNWQTLITPKAFQRPFTSRTFFSMYGWQYAARVFYRYREATDSSPDTARTDTVTR
ncbi:MAG: hypothetical protein ABIL09_19585 [Gemmatimonadota bacterium]